MLEVFSSGAQKFLKPKKKVRPRVPLSVRQLFLVVLTLVPNGFSNFGYSNNRPLPNFLSSISLLALVLFLADGFRVGELTASRQEKWTKEELAKIPRLN